MTKPIPTIESTSSFLRVIRQINAIVRPLSFIEERNRKYGDFYQVTFKNAPPTVITSNPEAIEEIFTALPDTFVVAKGNEILRFLVGDNSLLLQDGQLHRKRRSLLMPPFHGKSLQECSEKIVSITKEVCDFWQVNQVFKVRPYMQEITLGVILNLVFGVDSGERYEKLKQLLTTLLETFSNPLSASLLFFPIMQKDWGKSSPWGRLLLLKEEIRKLIYQEIQERRDLINSGKYFGRNILNLLIVSTDRNGERMTDAELHDELITLLFAGHETTASSLTWLFYWIHYLPEVQDKLRFELNNLGENPDYQEINNLPYLDAVISETLRIYPIAPNTFPRLLTKPMSVMGHNFEAETWLMISIYNLHRREELYPNSQQFKPERFLDKTYNPYEYIPFGGGHRRCIGSALALLEMKLVAATILSNFQLYLTSKRPILPVRRGLTLAPPASFKMVVKNKLGV